MDMLEALEEVYAIDDTKRKEVSKRGNKRLEDNASAAALVGEHCNGCGKVNHTRSSHCQSQGHNDYNASDTYMGCQRHLQKDKEATREG